MNALHIAVNATIALRVTADVDGYHILVSHHDGSTIGYSAVNVERSRLFLHSFEIRPELRGQGIGGDVLDTIVRLMRQEHPDLSLELYCFAERRAFYERHGWRVVSHGYLPSISVLRYVGG